MNPGPTLRLPLERTWHGIFDWQRCQTVGRIRAHDGKPVRGREFATPRGQEPEELRAVVKVSKGSAGGLWRLSVAGYHAGFRLDPRVPHVFATSPDRFFMPRSR